MTIRAEERRRTIDNDGLQLEAAVHVGERPLAAVIMHPHPLYGGDMDNHVVTALRDVFAARGATTVRFNFRGAGASEGEHDQGIGETLDALAAVDLAREMAPSASLILAGYSFGAMVATTAAHRVEAAAIVLVSPPAQAMGLIEAGPPPLLIVTGDEDQIAPANTLVISAPASARVVVVPGVNHSWWPGLDELRRALEAFLDSLADGS